MYKKTFKKYFDFFVSLTSLIIISPLVLIIAFYLWFVNKGNPFFIQDRAGKNGKVFKIIKFRTMNNDKDTFGNLLSDDKRLTKVGMFIRKTSLDELPQLFNVLIGNMSLIGPRPLLPEYLPFYSETQMKRHEVKPGITGLAQVNGRNSISWDEKFLLDITYVDTVSFSLDMKIIIKTFLKIFVTNEVSAQGHATMPRFDELMRLKKTNI